MSFDNFGPHSPTGYSHTKVSSNSFDPVYGRDIPYPNKLSVYIRKIDQADGSQAVVETRSPSELIGNRLYLWHRPLVNTAGTVTAITIGGGGSPVLDSSSTNSKQGYIVFSTSPTTTFTVSYLAAPDCITASHINNLQDEVMELQQVLGPTDLTGFPGLRNLAYGLFDSPADANLSTVAQRAVYLPHLNQNITIGSSDDPSVTATYGSSHGITIGRSTDWVNMNVTGFKVTQSNSSLSSRIELGTLTGDIVTYKGRFSGEGPMTIGGPLWPLFSGVAFSTGLTGSFYSGSMLRVHGDVAVMGGIHSVGPITVHTATGETSVVLGDFSVRDELYVYGQTHLIGDTDTNRLDVNNHIYLDGNLVANNTFNQTLVDGLDCSEIAHSYKTVTRKRIPYSVIDGPFTTTEVTPKLTAYAPHYSLTNSSCIGELFTITGLVNAPSGPSGAHPNIIQLNLNTNIVTGTLGTTGNTQGVWCKGLMDPGQLWLYVKAGQAAGFNTPLYGYTIESGNTTKLLKLNVFSPELVEPRPTTNDQVVLYNPHNVPYNFVKVTAGANPTFSISGSSSIPVKIAFADEVRILSAESANTSLSNALGNSITGQGGSFQTGVAYIFASMSGTDPESPPIFKTRATSQRMPWETIVGETTMYLSGSTWFELETVSYRPGGIYDSCWIPIVGQVTASNHSGRFIPALSTSSNPVKMYFQHQLGPDLDLYMSNMDLYLGAINTGAVTSFNQTHSNLYSMQGTDTRAGFGYGSFLRIPLNGIRDGSTANARDASIFYMDGKVIGIQMNQNLLDPIPTGATTAGDQDFNHLRLVIRRDV